MAEQKKWIQGAIKHKGAFRTWCQRHGFSKVTEGCISLALEVAKRTGNTTLARRANLARTLLSMQRRRK